MIGVDDLKVDPNRGWRHRFKTEARRVRMDPEVRDVIQGHKARTEGEQYGDMPLEMKWAEIKRLRRYDVSAPTGPRPVTEASLAASKKRMETAKRAKAVTAKAINAGLPLKLVKKAHFLVEPLDDDRQGKT